jgi:hypothetical protein
MVLPTIRAPARCLLSRDAGGLSALLVVLALSAALRLYRIQAECLWYDEAVTVQFLNEPTLADFVEQVRERDKLKMPLYMVVEYGWWHVTGKSVTALRCLSVGVSLATVAGMFVFARRIWGTAAAFLAGFCFAFSTPLIYHAQEVRMYTILYALACFSTASLYAAVCGSRRAWLLNGLFNFLVLSTHLVGPILFAAQGLFLVVDRTREWRRWFLWGVAHAMMFVPFIPWFRTFSDYDYAVEWIEPPTLETLLRTFAFEYPGTRLELFQNSAAGPWSALIIAIITICAAVYSIRRYVRRHDASRAVLLLACCWVMPALTMAALSYVVRPCYIDRIALYAALPFYILAGAGIAALPPWIRWPAIVALLVAYPAAATNVTRPIRPDLVSVIEYIDSWWRDGDTIYVKRPARHIAFRMYLGEHEDRLADVEGTLARALTNAGSGQRTWYVSPYDAERVNDWRRRIQSAHMRLGISVQEAIIPAAEPTLVYCFGPGTAKDRIHTEPKRDSVRRNKPRPNRQH